MGKLIDADKLKEQIEAIQVIEEGFRTGRTMVVLNVETMRSKILRLIDQQPEVKAPFEPVVEIKVDEEQIRKALKGSLEAARRRPLQPDPEIEYNGWIPMKKEQPKKSGNYLTCDRLGYMEVLWWADPSGYDIEEGEWRETATPEDVIAWRPLPKPYQEDES